MMNKGFTPESLRALVNDVVFWSKHTNGRRVGKSLVVKAIINGRASSLVDYVLSAKNGEMTPLPKGWHQPSV